MDPMGRVASGAVRRSLGPDPSMKSKVDLLRRLVAMRRDMKGPKAGINPPKRGGKYPPRSPRGDFIVDRGFGGRRGGGGSLPQMPGREERGVPTRLPRFDRIPGY